MGPVPERLQKAIWIPAVAVLPLLHDLSEWQWGLWVGGYTAVALWIAGLLFRPARNFFPAKLRWLFPTLFAGAATLAGFEFLGIPPLWSVSFFLLLPENLFEEKAEGFAVTLLTRGISFWLLCLYLAGLNGVLAPHAVAVFFRSPAGPAFLLALAALVWQNRPRPAQVRA